MYEENQPAISAISESSENPDVLAVLEETEKRYPSEKFFIIPTENLIQAAIVNLRHRARNNSYINPFLYSKSKRKRLLDEEKIIQLKCEGLADFLESRVREAKTMEELKTTTQMYENYESFVKTNSNVIGKGLTNCKIKEIPNYEYLKIYLGTKDFTKYMKANGFQQKQKRYYGYPTMFWCGLTLN